jgi:hypothetical protein
MAILVLDTYTSIVRLRESGFEEKQAKAVVDVLTSVNLDQVATKQDVKLEIAELKAELLKWTITLLIAQAGAIVALIKFLP